MQGLPENEIALPVPPVAISDQENKQKQRGSRKTVKQWRFSNTLGRFPQGVLLDFTRTEVWRSKRVEEAPATAMEVARRQTGDWTAARGRHAPDCSEQRWRAWGTWRRRCLRHRRGWLSRGEAVQIRWFPNGTASVDGGGRRRTAAENCKQVLKCCLTVLGSSETRFKGLGQPQTAAVTNGGQRWRMVADQMRQKPERDRPARIPT